MTNSEKRKRLMFAITDTEKLLSKATEKYNNSVICLKMDIKENKELGNPLSANRAWVDYCLEDKAQVKRYQEHITMLKDMLVQCN